MKKKILSMALALCLVFGSAVALPESVVVDETAVSVSAASSEWTYTTATGGIKLTKYKGKQTKVTIPSKVDGKTVVAIGYNLFSQSSSVTSVSIPDSVTEIDESFYGCTNLQTVSGMKKVKKIGSSSFYKCTKLSSINLPSTLQSIGAGAFSDCTSLKTVTIPASVTSIGSYAFSSCTNLTAINVNKNSKSFVSVNGALLSANKKTLYCCPAGKASFTIPTSVTTINNYAFEGCSKLTSLTVPKSVTTINSGAFYDCKSLKSISLPTTLKAINSWTFDSCTSLKNIAIPKGVTEINSGAFSGCTSLQLVNLPSTLKDIAESAFDGCKSLTVFAVDANNKNYWAISGDIYSKDKKALVMCAKGKKSISIPSSVTTIKDKACCDCKNLTTVNIPSSVKNFGAYAFENTPWINNLRKKNPYIIRNGVLIDARHVKTATAVVPKGVKTVTPYAFADNSYVTNVVFSGSVTTILEGAFFRCSKLASLVLPDSITKIDSGIVNSCRSLVTFKTGNGIKSLPGYTCVDCFSLKNVVIGNKVTSIGTRDFYNCDSLESIEIPHNVTKIGDYAFSDCAKLSDASLPYSNLTIGSAAFFSCPKLASIVVPNTVKSIGSGAFSRSNYATAANNTVIYGYNKTLAQTYAKNYKHTFKVLDPYQRIAGENRYGTAVAISKQSFKTTSNYVILTTGLDFHDALAAVPLAKAYNAPLLLTAPKTLTPDTLKEIKRLKAKNVIVVSTNGAVGADVTKALKNNKLTVTPITGKTSFETSKKVAEALQAKIKSNTKNKTTAPTDVFFTTNKAFADALSASPVAALKGAPILYVDPSKKTLDSNTLAYLNKVKGSVKNIYIVGGTTAIPTAIETNIKKVLTKGKVTRFAGANRYETCILVNNTFSKLLTSKSVCVAKGLDFPDALAGGVYAAYNKAPLFLSDNNLSDKQINYLKKKDASKIVLFGGIVAVPDKILGKVSQYSVK